MIIPLEFNSEPPFKSNNMGIIFLIIVVYVLLVAQKLKTKKNERFSSKIGRSLRYITAKFHIQGLYTFFQRLNASIQQEAQNRNARNNTAMNLKEAYDILGLQQNASKDEVNTAFRRLMLINHPDKGGTQYLANKIISAKEVILNNIR